MIVPKHQRRNRVHDVVKTEKRTKFGTMILSDGTLDYRFKGPIELNRSKRWPRAQTYQEAREKSPSAEPVR
jgi:hypothetical protein